MVGEKAADAKKPTAIIELEYSDFVILKKRGFTATITIDNTGNIVGKVEKEVKI
jgi:hypothetical protein